MLLVLVAGLRRLGLLQSKRMVVLARFLQSIVRRIKGRLTRMFVFERVDGETIILSSRELPSGKFRFQRQQVRADILQAHLRNDAVATANVRYVPSRSLRLASCRPKKAQNTRQAKYTVGV